MLVHNSISSVTSPASFPLAIRVFPASFGRVFVQFVQESQQNQPFFFRKDGGHIFHRGGVYAKPSICIFVFAKKVIGALLVSMLREPVLINAEIDESSFQ
jgi:hypothetical protein